MKTAATDGDATERAIAAAETTRANELGAGGAGRVACSHEVLARRTLTPASGAAGSGMPTSGQAHRRIGRARARARRDRHARGQARDEAERHESRRVKGEERVNALENDARAAPDELRDARRQLLSQTRRQTLFEAQNEVLEGKQRALTRYRDSLLASSRRWVWRPVASATGASRLGGNGDAPCPGWRTPAAGLNRLDGRACEHRRSCEERSPARSTTVPLRAWPTSRSRRRSSSAWSDAAIRAPKRS